MDLRENEAKIFILSGKARAGKDTTAGFIKNYYEGVGKKVINLSFASYIKDYAKKISNWDGNEDDKPRELLQMLGTEIIRNRIDEDFFINRIIEDIKVYSFFFDVIVISDARFKREIETVKKSYSDALSINIVRPGFQSELTSVQMGHATEIDLDNYNGYDKELLNDGTIEDLGNKVNDLLDKI